MGTKTFALIAVADQLVPDAVNDDRVVGRDGVEIMPRRVAALGYNYIQNPLIRQIKAALDAGTIGRVNHVRIEMDEDFMANADAPFGPSKE